ncbi:MAG: hypothetical protein A2W91_18970 [Bacteroidetes bacterium GWF2_38_335]|nr:MAG: hypothetical protein A2W91_18970 [Bacteroidetes bacterium GWF2_38_335]OFY80244.1 MAG: hypothetical protein A2281_17225 [Bacteroidetes bacterium RIFOXYA12_FULL_38_20]HBS88726.1 hypothetical protein [Bacteroidales bacterium]
MVKYIIIILLHILIPLISFPQENKIIIENENPDEFSIASFIYTLEDKENNLSIENVILKHENEFTLNKTESVNFGFTRSAYWLRFTIVNKSAQRQNLVFSINYPLINELDFYEIKEFRLIRKIKTGEHRVFSSRDIENKDFAFNLLLKPYSEYTYYIRVYNHGETLRIPMKLDTIKNFFIEEQSTRLGDGMFFGLFIFVVLFNLFLFITIKERLYFFYSLYVLLFTMLIFNTDGYSFQYLWPNNPYWANTSTIVIVSLANFFLLLFTQIFLDFKNLSRNVWIINYGFKILFLVISVIVFFGGFFSVFAMKSINIVSMFAVIFAIITSIVALKKHTMFARYFLISYFLLMVGVIIYVFRNLGIVPNNLLSLYGLKVGFAIEVILLSIAVSDRFRRIKERANQELEGLVKIRTAEIRAQKEEILTQRDEIEAQRDSIIEQRDKIVEQNQEIKSSIMYASRIQKAIFPPQSIFERYLPNHFIFYLPRDIVSGDFYWIYNKNNLLCFAVADCTGHGVPGAFMSVLGMTILNETAAKIEQTDAGIFLDELRENLVRSLHQKGIEGDTQDGLDISLVIFDKEKREFSFAGANNPLYLVCKNIPSWIDESDRFSLFQNNNQKNKNVLVEIKADKMPIGVHRHYKTKFTGHNLSLPGDCTMYLFSDGYADQFGGSEKKKYKYQQFKEMLLSISHMELPDQRKIIERDFEMWRGELAQIDDVLILGIKV